ncbi:hypothetical protein, partial [Guyparkeria sp.]|uniref:hypothetical protein n=1 Tax=Guyparkeria sp. TaxID=2035736 RepID=UPI003970CDD7
TQHKLLHDIHGTPFSILDQLTPQVTVLSQQNRTCEHPAAPSGSRNLPDSGGRRKAPEQKVPPRWHKPLRCNDF